MLVKVILEVPNHKKIQEIDQLLQFPQTEITRKSLLTSMLATPEGIEYFETHFYELLEDNPIFYEDDGAAERVDISMLSLYLHQTYLDFKSQMSSLFPGKIVVLNRVIKNKMENGLLVELDLESIT
jgi:hypothetical protein